MINVEEIYQTLNQVITKDGAGSVSSDEFNNFSALAENDLFDYYISRYEQDRVIAEPILQFHTSATLASPYALPGDYRHRAEVFVEAYESNNGASVKKQFPCHYLHDGSKGLTLSSPIRKPSLANREFAYERNGDNLKVYPDGVPVLLYYFAQWDYAVRGFTYNGTTDEEEYDSGTSTNYAWNNSERSNLIDLICFYKGLRLRENAIVQWVAAKKNLTAVPEKLKL